MEHQYWIVGTSLVVQWLRLRAPTAGAWGGPLVRELEPHAATEDPVYRHEDPAQPNKEINTKTNKKGGLCLGYRQNETSPQTQEVQPSFGTGTVVREHLLSRP